MELAKPNVKVPYVRLGNSGLKVSKLILGMMSYGSSKWQDWVLDEEESFKHIKYAYDSGINTFDTANMYSNGESEVVLGNSLKHFKIPREKVVILTKVYNACVPEDLSFKNVGIDPDEFGLINEWGLSRKHIFASIKASLQRLQLDYVDVLQCHRFDYNTPIEETMQALHDVVKAGYARYIGMSSCHAYQFHAMQNYAISHNLTPFISMQDMHSAVYREEEREMFPTLKMFNVDKNFARILGAEGSADRSAVFEVNKRVESIAKKHGRSMAQVALAYSLAKEAVTAPIIGTTKLDSIKELIEALDIKLDDAEIQSIEEPYIPRAIQGYN
ncbi:Aldo/keto reductase [Atractiella rhizophila]|nr:Aldo/keto reductase [Atractiella rhizophila]